MPLWIKSASEIHAARETAVVLCAALEAGAARVAPGTTTAEINAIVEASLRCAGAEPILAGYSIGAGRRFLHASCVSVNEQALHAVPGARTLQPGDLVSIDASARLHGFCADAAIAIAVDHSPRARSLIDACRACLRAALDQMHAGTKWSRVAGAAQAAARSRGVALAGGYDGHGIGRDLHEPPRCWLAGGPSDSLPDFDLREGMVLTLEPIVVEGSTHLTTLADGWTVVTADGSWACHEEITVAIATNGPDVLTRTRSLP